MPARVIDGKAVAEARRSALKVKVQALRDRGIQPALAALTVSNDQAWGVYLKNQAQACVAIGIKHHIVQLPEPSTQDDLNERIESLNVDAGIHGIILQSPLPKHLNDLQAQAQLSPDKDVEGVGPANMGLVLAGKPAAAPCTALAAVALAKEAIADLRGVEAVVVGASNIVGKPIAQLLLAQGATVTTCHIDTKNLAQHTRAADLLVVAVGKAGLITPDLVKAGAVVIDVGINRMTGPSGKIETVGDVHPDVAKVASALSPVPGGVGALTTVCLLEATVAAAERLADAQPVVQGAALTRVLGGPELPLDVADRVATLLSRHMIHTPGSGASRSPLERRMTQGMVIFDGAMGSELIAEGINAAAIAAANIEHPDLVKRVHRSYLEAGAEVLTANTFAVNRYRCDNDRERTVRLAQAGVRLAREVAHGKAFVIGSIGPLGRVIGADISQAVAEDAYAEVALALVDAGVDGFVIETMPSTEEASAALSGVRRMSRLPAIVSRSFDRDDPSELTEFARACEAGGAAAIGINCATGPRAMVNVVGRLAKISRLPVLARPNAGFPSRVEGRLHYHLRPEYFVEQAQAYAANGVNLIGGCCGVGPAHIRALSQALGHKPLPPRPQHDPAVAEHAAPDQHVHPLMHLAKQGEFPVLAFCPGRLSPVASAAALERLAKAGAEAVGVLSGWPGAPRGARLPARLRHLQDATGKTAVLELIAEGLTLPAAQEILLTAHLLGIRLVLIDSGVFAAESRADAQSRGCDPLELLALVARLNSGRDLGGSHLEERAAFTAGVRVAVGRVDQVERYVAEGAQFLTVQPIYDPKRFRQVMEKMHVDVPLFAEVLLLPDAATADEIDNELPALSVPDALKKRLAADPGEDVIGVLRFLTYWRSRLAGVCLLLPDDRTQPAEAVLRAIRK
jgi:methylenetetrahydrofolate dehydrogenase (NADP+)/methenyltetrahydrofolate cyclohydrolase